MKTSQVQKETETLLCTGAGQKKSSTELEAWTVVGNDEAAPNLFALN